MLTCLGSAALLALIRGRGTACGTSSWSSDGAPKFSSVVATKAFRSRVPVWALCRAHEERIDGRGGAFVWLWRVPTADPVGVRAFPNGE
jgi:hypothetical protein